MPSEILDGLFRTARERIGNASYKDKALMLELLTVQADREIQVCDDALREYKGRSALSSISNSPSIHERIRLQNEITITEYERSEIVKLKEEARKLLLSNSDNELAEDNGASQMKVFISHSETNTNIAESLINYLQSALSLADEDIRCTSVPGHKLPFGKSIAEALRNDLTLTPTLIVLVTEESINSTWVMFELGAAWVLNKSIVPILAPGIKVASLPRLLNEVPCILMDKEDASSRLSGLATELATKFRLQHKSGEKTHSNLERFVNLFRAYKSNGNTEKPVSNGTRSTKINDNDSILRAIWMLDADNKDRSESGYHVTIIAKCINGVIPHCEEILDSLVENSLLSKQGYLSPPPSGNRYKLTSIGRRYLMGTYPDLCTPKT